MRGISRLDRPGLTRTQERIFNVVSALIVVLFTIGWTYAIADAHARDATPPIRAATESLNPFSGNAPPAAPYVLDATIRALTREPRLHGYSGAVKIGTQIPGESIPLPDSLRAQSELAYTERGTQAPAVPAPGRAGVWNVLVRVGDAIQAIPDFSLIQLVPLSEKRGGKIGSYEIGFWPYESGGVPRRASYAPPRGLVRVTPQNLNTPVSEHFLLRDFVTKGQVDVWPKYVALSTQLLDKLELTIQELQREGHPVENVGVISGFRTPYYNKSGGDPRGRGALSRHMYGDAMDIYIDNNNDGRMDDLNGDGRVDIKDARVLAAAADRVEKQYPSLTGGIGVYAPTGAHSGFVHIDTRGFRARW
jgi:uncharacterized protein YcbK (DUF882 family)